jgi:hypothetical protein
MKNIYSNSGKHLLSTRKRLADLASKLITSLKNNFSFHNVHSELLLIWTIIFTIITGLFLLAIGSNVLVIFSYLIAAIIVTYAGTLAAIYYLHALKYHSKEKHLPKIHRALNRTIRIRDLFRFIKIPYFSKAESVDKNYKLAA